jgi:hypothetical protein
LQARASELNGINSESIVYGVAPCFDAEPPHTPRPRAVGHMTGVPEVNDARLEQHPVFNAHVTRVLDDLKELEKERGGLYTVKFGMVRLPQLGAAPALRARLKSVQVAAIIPRVHACRAAQMYKCTNVRNRDVGAASALGAG